MHTFVLLDFEVCFFERYGSTGGYLMSRSWKTASAPSLKPWNALIDQHDVHGCHEYIEDITDTMIELLVWQRTEKRTAII